MAGARAAARCASMTTKSPRAMAERKAHDARMAQIDFNNSPFTIAWELTRACAFACRHCRAEAQPKRNPNELTTEEAFRSAGRRRSQSATLMS